MTGLESTVPPDLPPEPADAASPGQAAEPAVVLAAGVVCWRTGRGSREGRSQREVRGQRDGRGQADAGVEVLLVHRPRYDDWSWPKGKLEPGESAPECAVREAAEETGCQVLLGRPLPPVEYLLPTGELKQVQYWAARVVGSGPRTARPTEIDDSRWVPVDQARELLTQPSEHAVLDTLTAGLRAGELATRTVLVIRHATARPRDGWSRPESERPLVASGRRQALALGAMLRCWRPEYVLSSPWRRCLETLQPYAAASGVRIRTKDGLTEDGFRRSPGKARKHLLAVLDRDRTAALCTHRPVLATVMEAIREACAPDVRELIPDGDPYLAPAEILVLHTCPAGHGRPLVVAAERHRPVY